MNKAEIKDMQQVLLEDLKVFNSFCEDNHIDYFLSSGSLLGAIRHEGFIPWDDDLDIMLTRDNYNKLLSLANDYPSKYLILNYTNDNDIPIIYSHLVDTRYKFYKTLTGTNRDYLHIDIYACDYIKNSKFTKSRLLKWVELIINRFYSYRKGHISFDDNQILKSIAMKVCNLLFYGWSDAQLIGLINRIVRAKVDEGLMAPIASPYGFQKEMFPTRYYEELIKVNFEDTMVPISKYYDDILKQLYGNYLELPPEDQRYKEIEIYQFEKCESVDI